MYNGPLEIATTTVVRAWDGATAGNAMAANGLYFYRLLVSGSKGKDVLTRKVLLLR